MKHFNNICNEQIFRFQNFNKKIFMSNELQTAEQDVIESITILKTTVNRLRSEENEETKNRLLKEAKKAVLFTILIAYNRVKRQINT